MRFDEFVCSTIFHVVSLFSLCTLCSFYSTAAETLYSAPRRFGKFIEMQNPREAIRITMRRSWPYKVSRSHSRSEATHTSNTPRSRRERRGSEALRHCAASRGQNHSLPGRSVSRQRLIESAATALTRFTGREFSLKYTRDCCCFCLLFAVPCFCPLFPVRSSPLVMARNKKRFKVIRTC